MSVYLVTRTLVRAVFYTAASLVLPAAILLASCWCGGAL